VILASKKKRGRCVPAARRSVREEKEGVRLNVGKPLPSVVRQTSLMQKGKRTGGKEKNCAAAGRGKENAGNDRKGLRSLLAPERKGNDDYKGEQKRTP